MDGFEINKILGALLGTALLVIAIGNIADAVYEPEPLKTAAFPVEVPTGGTTQTAEAAKPVDLGTVLAAADVKKGESIARSKCTACHTLDKGQPAATGPNLYGIVGGPTAHMGDAFNYSSAMKKFGGNWSFDRLWAFLANPRADLPGTAMTFVGLPKEGERADVIAWLRTNSDSPVPLPAPQSAAATPAEPTATASTGAPEGATPNAAAPAGAPSGGTAPAGTPSATGGAPTAPTSPSQAGAAAGSSPQPADSVTPTGSATTPFTKP